MPRDGCCEDITHFETRHTIWPSSLDEQKRSEHSATVVDRELSNKQKMALYLTTVFGAVAVSGFFGWAVSETNHAHKNESPNAMVVDKTATFRCSNDKAPAIERTNKAVTIMCQP